MNLVEDKNGKPVTSSKLVADTFGKIHRDVMRSIKNLDCSDEFRARNFAQSSYISPQNKELPCYEITRDGFAFLCMGFTGKEAAAWKEKYIGAFNSMEGVIAQSVKSPSSMAALNELTRKIESDKDVASFCGSELAKYKKIKKENESAFIAEIENAQLKLGFKKGE